MRNDWVFLLEKGTPKVVGLSHLPVDLEMRSKVSQKAEDIPHFTFIGRGNSPSLWIPSQGLINELCCPPAALPAVPQGAAGARATAA